MTLENFSAIRVAGVTHFWILEDWKARLPLALMILFWT